MSKLAKFQLWSSGLATGLIFMEIVEWRIAMAIVFLGFAAALALLCAIADAP